MAENNKPNGELAVQALCMPRDTNPSGDIFGGWVLSQMDIAGAVEAKKIANGRVVTIAVDAMEFLLPVLVGDVISCYAEITKVGRSSIATKVETWVKRQYETDIIKVTEGTFTYVAVDKDRKPRPVEK